MSDSQNTRRERSGRGKAPGASGASAELSGPARRRARTHAALLSAGRDLIARGEEDASIEEITRRAGVGFGSFANHFREGKASFFHEAALGMLGDLGEKIGRLAAQEADPAEAVAVGFRATIRMARADAGLRAVLLRPGTDVLFAADTLLAAAGRDVRRGIQDGQFVDADPDLLLVGIGSVLIGTLRFLDETDRHATPQRLSEVEVIDQATDAALRLLGLIRPRG